MFFFGEILCKFKTHLHNLVLLHRAFVLVVVQVALLVPFIRAVLYFVLQVAGLLRSRRRRRDLRLLQEIRISGQAEQIFATSADNFALQDNVFIIMPYNINRTAGGAGIFTVPPGRRFAPAVFRSPVSLYLRSTSGPSKSRLFYIFSSEDGLQITKGGLMKLQLENQYVGLVSMGGLRGILTYHHKGKLKLVMLMLIN